MLRVLGEVDACVGGTVLDLGYPKQRCVLAALVVDRGRAVPIDLLVDRVWGSSAPPRGRETVHSYISRLRRVLGVLGGAGIARRAGGYALETDSTAVDLYLFDDLRAKARTSTTDKHAVARLTEALALWRGPALAGLPGEWADAERERLGREHLATRLDLLETRLRLGEGRQLVTELATLADEHPYDEQIARQYMTALHRAGRTADALDHFRRIRGQLASELGVDPAAPLRELHQRLLGTNQPVAGPPVVPRQLPAAIRDFTGRDEHLAELDALLPSHDQAAGHAVVISALDGSAGIGKTTLAVHWAHRVQHRFPDGTLHTNLRGYGPGRPASPDEALDDFLVALGVPAAAVPAGTTARTGLLRTLLSGRRVLIVLDNANSAEQVRPLLPGTPGSMVLVTSRDSLTGLVVTDAAHRLTLDVLTSAEALRLVTGIVGRERATAEAGALRELVRLCARLPLALRIAAARVAAQQHVSITDVVAELAGDNRSRLDVLAWGDDPYAAVRTVLDWSYERLPARQALLFRRLGLHPGPDVSLPAAAALLGLPVRETRDLLTALVHANLIASVARDRFHDLLRAYAAEHAHDLDHEDDRRQALDALLTWYAHTAHNADRLLYPASTRLVSRPPEPRCPHPLADRNHAWAWFTAERANLIAALHHAADAELDEHALGLVDAFGFLVLMGGWDERITTADAALVSARRAGDHAHEANVLLARGEALVHLNRPDAEADLTRAAELARETGHTPVRIAALNDLGRLMLGQGRHADARRFLDTALTLSRGVDTGRWEAIVNGMLAKVHTDAGDHGKAIEHGQRSARLRHRIGDSDGEACALTSLAKAWQGLGEHDRAIAHCRQAIALGRASLGSQDETLAPPLAVLAGSLHHLGRVGEALECWREAAAIYAERGLDADAAAIREHLLTTVPALPPDQRAMTVYP
ncbi:BTAD domain-containing putative transcriptional regulator [Amycolatopsis sp. 195334CR]|uniref:AfsR/SARP family transcriptional regulator n=1 Tax=Amycolatopsis sp. 195334CR TaxID=2814588 RepID=UPI001A90B8D3|nr:BTAD domain-containing putative transcriptional regulator [Amycolatopsis sp. 195334CR]MBN6034099.1 tetratricopeptide repeat protein [Amycolatopsis sp. 195334CR]